MSLYDFAQFQVAAKTIMHRGDEVLALIWQDGLIDFPGGRMDKSELDIPLTEVLKREVSEELGENVQYDIGQLLFVSKRQFSDKNVLCVYYRTDYISGEIKLSDEHIGLQWVKLSDLPDDPTKYIATDEFEQVKNYLGLN